MNFRDQRLCRGQPKSICQEIQVVSKWLVLGWVIFYEKYLKYLPSYNWCILCFELEGTDVNLLIWWFEDNWLLRLGAIVIQMKFDVFMDLLKRRKLNKFSPDDEILQWKCETSRFLLKHVTSEQKVLSSWNKFPTEDKTTEISLNVFLNLNRCIA